MKRITYILVVCSILVLASLAFAPAPVMHIMSQAPDPGDGSALPVWLGLGIVAAVNWIVTNGLKSFSKALPWTPDLSGIGTAIASGISNAVILFVSTVLTTLPVAYQNPVGYALAFIGSLLGSFGIHFVVKSFQPQPSA